MIFIKIMRRYTFGPRSEKYVRFMNIIKLIEKINLKSIKTDVVLKHDSYLKKKRIKIGRLFFPLRTGSFKTIIIDLAGQE